MKPKLTIKSIVNHFGGATQLSRLLSKGCEVSKSSRTVESWIYRDSIPAKKLMDLVLLGDKIGKPLVLDQHIQK